MSVARSSSQTTDKILQSGMLHVLADAFLAQGFDMPPNANGSESDV
jgi:hypothetical protein